MPPKMHRDVQRVMRSVWVLGLGRSTQRPRAVEITTIVILDTAIANGTTTRNVHVTITLISAMIVTYGRFDSSTLSADTPIISMAEVVIQLIMIGMIVMTLIIMMMIIVLIILVVVVVVVVLMIIKYAIVTRLCACRMTDTRFQTAPRLPSSPERNVRGVWRGDMHSGISKIGLVHS